MPTPYKIWRSPNSDFAEGAKLERDADLRDEAVTANDAYTDKELERIAAEGFNGIWVYGTLSNIVRVEPFPELGHNSEKQIAAISSLITRAARHGIGVWLYMQPPRSVPVENEAFWNNHPDIWGQESLKEGIGMDPPALFRALCTSTAPVKEWLLRASAELMRRLPGLGGVIVISASEFNSHCYTHHTRYKVEEYLPAIECERCRQREPEEVTSEVLTLLAKGLHSVNPDIPFVAWNWSWSWREDSNERVIKLLPDDVIVMADFERGGILDIPGGRRRHRYDEYSLTYPGPSERFQRCYEVVKQKGLKMMAKLQFGTTHELGTVVSLPLLTSVFEKANFTCREKLEGFMGCWNFGNHPSANTAGFNYFLSLDPSIDRATALEQFALYYFGGGDAGLLRLAWEAFAEAMTHFPFTIAFLYHGAHAHTLSYRQIYRAAPLEGTPAGRSWQPDERGDDVENSFNLHHKQFNLQDIIERLGKVAVVWKTGVKLMELALVSDLGQGEINKARVDTELGNAIICGAIWRSAENTYKIYRLRRNWSDAQLQEFLEITNDELSILAHVLPYVEADSRQGYHLEPHVYMFSPETIREKIAALEALIRTHGEPAPRNIVA